MYDSTRTFLKALLLNGLTEGLLGPVDPLVRSGGELWHRGAESKR